MDTGGVVSVNKKVILLQYCTIHNNRRTSWITGCRVKCSDSHGSIQVYPYVESMPSGPPRIHDEVNELAAKAITGNDSEVI